MKKSISFLVFIVIFTTTIAQNLNKYKYIIIPNQYDFLRGEDQYKLNSLTKFLFEKENFITIFKNNKIPTDLYENPCLGLTAKVNKVSNFLTTALEIQLENCNREIVFTSKKGKSKIKEYKRSYHEALRDAFISVQKLHYTYKHFKTTQITPSIKKTAVLIKKSTANKNSLSKPVGTPINKYENTDEIVLYAQKTKNGFQLVDNSPKVLYTLLNTSKKEVYLLKNKQGYFYKTVNNWVIEYYEKEVLISKILNVKF